MVGSDWKGKEVVGSDYAKEVRFSIESETTQQPTSLRVLLIGESCIDEYHYGECRRLSPEAPVPVLDYTKTTYILVWHLMFFRT